MERLEPSSRFRQHKGAMAVLVRVLLIALPLIGMVWILHIPELLGFAFFQAQYLGLMLALTLFLVFLLAPATKRVGTGELPWYDAILALLGLVAGGYLALVYPQVMLLPFRGAPTDLIIGIITILLVLEATRRLAGLTLTGLAIFFIFYALYCNLFPGFLQGRGYSWSYLVPYLYFQTSGIPGVILAIAFTIVLAYVLFGQALFLSGGGKILIDLSLSVVGRFRGGPAKAAVVASSLFGTISGTAVSNVMTTGTFTIPMMKSIGYRSHFAAAVEATSSTGGTIMPPVMGAAAFVMAEFMGIGYYKVVIAAAIPAILYYIAVFTQVHLEAVKTGIRCLSPEEVPRLKKTINKSWQFILPLIVLIYFLLIGRFNATTAGLYAVASVILVSLPRKESRLGPRRILSVLEATGRMVLDIGVICAMSGIIIGVVNITGLGNNLSRVLVGMAGDNILPLLIMAAIASTILGMGMPMTPCYILLAMLLVPALVKLGVVPLAAHMFVLYFGALSFLTPPVAVASYAAATLAGSDFWRTGWQAMRLAIVAYLIPFFFVYNPILLMQGTATSIGLAFITAVIGTMLLAVGIEGYFFHHISLLTRGLFILGGIGCIIPGWQTDLLALAPLVWEWKVIVSFSRKQIGKVGSLISGLHACD